ncbi:MBL fold metallo-hydrolase [Deinococcus sp. HMF7604]|uniref:ComEC/Rec2 family competence protein n=1 Tax=Deinococcus betulae TaxID=2873312 RepID=UPI001CCAF58E|nr:MBL fold metallo-hydrolase [Deinococcus betulae]MBZ9752485.1 MBL fold metallo-hydrolase [Deinococcus betulae]
MDQLLILDVGHGNASIIESQGLFAVIDAAPGASLVQTLSKLSVSSIEHVFISHADEDHIGGLTAILSSRNLIVKNLHLCPDLKKDGANMRRLQIAVDDSISRNNTKLHLQYASSHASCEFADIAIYTVAPPGSTAFLGNGGRSTTGVPITSNSASAVYSVYHAGHRIALFGGDMDGQSLDFIKANNVAIDSDILIFPHHGGLAGSGTNMEEFTQSLIDVVRPKSVIFSISRNKYSNPLRAVVDTVISSKPEIKILCTQLSKQCSPESSFNPVLLDEYSKHLTLLPSASQKSNEYCAGSIKVILQGQNSVIERRLEHTDFVKSFVDSPMCGLYNSDN